MESILVVCEGNICRSPMAQGLMAAALPDAQVRSAGLGALVGMPADDTALRLMHDRGIDIGSHRAVQITREMCKQAELVLVMSADQRKTVEETYPTSRGRVFRIAEHVRRDVPDPYRQSEQVFRDALAIIEQGVRDWLDRMQRI
jgi:protein-tyrosine phosphatase